MTPAETDVVGLLEAASLAVAGVAVPAGVLALLGTGQVRSALPLTLDFLTAAGLLRLSAQQSWSAIASAATIVVVRHLVTWAFARRSRLLDQRTASGRPAIATRGARDRS